MKKLDNFRKSLNTLAGADISAAANDDIYRMGIFGQFNLTFELAWKALQAVMRLHSVGGAETGSPREILKLGLSVGFLTDEAAWLDMIADRNRLTHVYDSDVSEILCRVTERYIPAFRRLADELALRS